MASGSGRRAAEAPKLKKSAKPFIVIGEILIMSGMFVAGFVGWSGFQENAIAASQGEVATEVNQRWQNDQSTPTWDVPPKEGDDLAIIEIPKFGEDYRRVIVEGVNLAVLNDPRSGVGHYPDTAKPGEVGNFSLAAHRYGNGGPFRQLDKLKFGDEIRITHGETTWVYRVIWSTVVTPQDVYVLDADDDRSTITLTTCTPMWTWENRLVVRGELYEVEGGIG